ncbi:MAG: hypothetical protein MR866_10595 [Selenomonadaceae bacterium]|nr:hypothetical protein [Selenomonadaceae bacterium]
MSERECYEDLLACLAPYRHILLYGLSDATRALLEACPELPVEGLLDGFQTEGMLYGKPVVPLTQAVELGTEAIVIVARQTSTGIIAKRIEGFVREQGIRIYDWQGRDLLVRVQEQAVPDHPYFQLTLRQVQQAISQHEVITFDVFDTLIMRGVPEPDDVFALLAQREHCLAFVSKRMQAEHELYRGGGNPTLAEIYARLHQKMGWTQAEAEAWQEKELALERALLVPRPGMAQLVNWAKEQGKRVCLISDMYLPSAWLQDVLTELGVRGYDALLVSCEARTSKLQELFAVCQQQFHARSYLHIGDSPEADGEAARAHGFDVVHVASAREMAELSTWRKPLRDARSLAEKLLAGQLLQRRFSSPFALQGSKGRPQLARGQELGYCIFGPMLVAFFYWVMQRAAGRQEVILWAARDGYLFARMHEELLRARTASRTGLPQGCYFYTSRMASLPAALHDADDIRYLAQIGFAGTLEQMLRQRFGVPEDEILPQGKDEPMLPYILRHTAAILRQAQARRQRAGRYWQSLGCEGKSLAFVDLVSSGSCHMAAEDLSGQRMAGYYLIHIEEAYAKKERLSCQAYLESSRLMMLKSILAANYEPLETSVMSDEPTLADFDMQGRPVFGKEQRTLADMQYLREVQQGIMDCFHDTLPWADIFLQEAIRPEFVDTIYGFLRTNKTRIEDCSLATAKVADDFTNRVFTMKNMFD